MTLASMHPMFQVSIDFCDHSSPSIFGKSTVTYSCACQAKVAVGAESKLHNRNCRSYWNLEVSTRVPRLESSDVSICKLQPLYFVTCCFCRSLHYERWKLCGAHFVKCPKIKTNFLDSQNCIWQVLKTSTLNTAFRYWSKSWMSFIEYGFKNQSMLCKGGWARVHGQLPTPISPTISDDLANKPRMTSGFLNKVWKMQLRWFQDAKNSGWLLIRAIEDVQKKNMHSIMSEITYTTHIQFYLQGQSCIFPAASSSTMVEGAKTNTLSKTNTYKRLPIAKVLRPWTILAV